MMVSSCLFSCCDWVKPLVLWVYVGVEPGEWVVRGSGGRLVVVCESVARSSCRDDAASAFSIILNAQPTTDVPYPVLVVWGNSRAVETTIGAALEDYWSLIFSLSHQRNASKAQKRFLRFD